MARALRIAVACVLVFFAVGVAILPLQTAVFTRAVSFRVSQADEVGLTRERMVEVAELVRAFVVEGKGVLPREVDGIAGFDTSATEHLVDVREVLRGTRLVTIALGLGLVVWVVVAKKRGDVAGISSAMRLGAILTLALPAAGLVAGVLSFDVLFSAFHSLFFASGTWVFPSDSLLIRTFPEIFWITCGVAWAMLVLAFAGCLAATAAALERGSTRTVPESCSQVPRDEA